MEGVSSGGLLRGRLVLFLDPGSGLSPVHSHVICETACVCMDVIFHHEKYTFCVQRSSKNPEAYLKTRFHPPISFL